MILAVECYIISFNSFDPFTFIFPFIKSFLFFGLGGGVHFWPSHKLGGKFWIWGFFGGVKGVALVISLSWLKITVLLPPPLVIKAYSPLKYGMTLQLCSTIIKILLVTFCL